MTKKSTTKATEREPETMVERLTRLLNDEERRMATEKDPTKRQTAVRTLVMLSSELRKADKEARKSADELDEATVVEWFRRLDITRAARFLRELQVITNNSKRSGLA